MKKLIYFTIVILISITFSCKKDSTETPEAAESTLTKVIEKNEHFGYIDKAILLPNGNILTGGEIYDSIVIKNTTYYSDDVDIFFIEYSPDGDYVKHKIFNLVNYQGLIDFEVGTDGNIVVVINFQNNIDLGVGPIVATNSNDDCIFRMNSNFQVINAYGFGGDNYRFTKDITLDQNNNPIALIEVDEPFNLNGVDVGVISGRSTLGVIKFNNTLTSSAYQIFYGNASTEIRPKTITADNNGNIYFGGYYSGKVFFSSSAIASTTEQGFLVKMNNSLNVDWDKTGTGSGKFSVNNLVSDGTNVYSANNVSNAVNWDGIDYNFATSGVVLQKISSNGDLTWSKNISGVYAYNYGISYSNNRIIIFPGKNSGTLNINRGGPPFSELMVFDLNGLLKWRKNFETTGATYNFFYINHAVADKNQRIWIMGNTNGNINVNNNGSSLTEGNFGITTNGQFFLLKY